MARRDFAAPKTPIGERLDTARSIAADLSAHALAAHNDSIRVLALAEQLAEALANGVPLDDESAEAVALLPQWREQRVSTAASLQRLRARVEAL